MPICTIDALAPHLGLCGATVRRLIKTNKIPRDCIVRIGVGQRHIRILTERLRIAGWLPQAVAS